MSSIYLCKNCGELKEGSSTPSQANCKKLGTHQWIRIGQPGGTSYHCSYCNITVKTMSKPVEFGCPKNGKHNWK